MPTYQYGHKPKNVAANDPGAKKKLYIAPRGSFTTLAAPSGAGAAAGDTIEIATDHVFNSGQGFTEMYTTLDTQELVAEMVGDRDSRVLNPKFDCFHPGLYKEILEFSSWIKDDDFIVLVPLPDGTVVQIGFDGMEASIMSKAESGKNSGGSKGSTFTIESFGNLFVYSGAIKIKSHPNATAAVVENAAPANWVLTIDEAVNYTNASGFTLYINGTPANITGIAGDGTTTVTLTTTETVTVGQTLTYDYDPVQGNTRAVTGGKELNQVIGAAVTNNTV